MSDIQINSNEKRLTINGDPDRVIVFDPSDSIFAEKFYNLFDNFKQRADEYKQRSVELEENEKVDDAGLPNNLKQRIQLVTEICNHFRDEIDNVFGEGTSQKAFGDVRNFDVIKQFFNGITPYIQQARAAKVEKYTNARPKRAKR